MNESKPGPSTKKRKLFEVASQASTLNSNIIISNVSQNMKYSQGSPMFLSRMKALITMIINCMLPISLVSNVDFRAFLYVFDPYFVCPDVRTAKKKVFETRDYIRNKIKDKISSMSHLNISIDIWTDATMRSYIGYIVSGINDKWQIVHHTLDFKLLKKRHTGDAIKEAYDQLCFDNRNFFLF